MTLSSLTTNPLEAPAFCITHTVDGRCLAAELETVVVDDALVVPAKYLRDACLGAIDGQC
jgi:hypothetical protein